jgi:Bacteriocin-protection, YdeI or OmpD-Associated/Domain of unknown function (DUF1905)
MNQHLSFQVPLIRLMGDHRPERREIMKFRTYVEPPEPMRGLEVPSEVVESLGQGKRPRVTITINGHSWKSRVAIMRGRYLLGLSNANRQAAGVESGDEVEVELEFDPGPRLVAEPADFARALSADPIARTAYDRLPDGRKREHVRAIESAKKPETRLRRIEKALVTLRNLDSAGRAAARGRTRASNSMSGES